MTAGRKRYKPLKRSCKIFDVGLPKSCGHFELDCRVLDGSRVMGADSVELEVLFKGRFSDVGLPGSPPERT